MNHQLAGTNQMLDQNKPSQPTPEVGIPWITRGGLLLLCLLGLGLRLRLAVPLPLWLDEGLIWGDCQLPLDELLLWKFTQFPGPLYDLFARISIACFGPSELALRLPSIAFGIANILVGFRLASG